MPITVVLANGQMITGKVVDSSKYWMKISADGRVVYVNKAWVALIEPAAGGGAQRQGGSSEEKPGGSAERAGARGVGR
ncbi:MAG: hypothetical protein ABWK00_01400 [Desulfurococcaceae archaeon]